MRFSSVVSLVAGALPLAASATRGQLGYAIGAKNPGTNMETTEGDLIIS